MTKRAFSFISSAVVLVIVFGFFVVDVRRCKNALKIDYPAHNYLSVSIACKNTPRFVLSDDQTFQIVYADIISIQKDEKTALRLERLSVSGHKRASLYYNLYHYITWSAYNGHDKAVTREALTAIQAMSGYDVILARAFIAHEIGDEVAADAYLESAEAMHISKWTKCMRENKFNYACIPH